MRLICAHCDHYDAAPLPKVPRGWVDIVPDPEPPPPLVAIEFKTEAGTMADAFGICPACEQHRKTAFTMADKDRDGRPTEAMLF